LQNFSKNTIILIVGGNTFIHKGNAPLKTKAISLHNNPPKSHQTSLYSHQI